MSLSHQPAAAFQVLVDAVRDLSAGLSETKRYERLLNAAQRLVESDAAALLRIGEDRMLHPLAVRGLSPATLGRAFDPREHPRLLTILRSTHPVIFDADDPRPDPFDGAILGDPSGRITVHSCMGAALWDGDEVVGVITLDALEANRFSDVDRDAVSAFASLAASTIKTVELIETLEHIAEHRGQIAQHMVREELKRRGGALIGHGSAMAKVKSEVELVADSELTVLISGETGTGKELVARSIHARSNRSGKPLVYVNCAALPESVAESELFGHVEGAFTGAIRRRKGKFQLSDGATLFLDEVGELPQSIQTKLLRALQFGEVQAVGEDRTRTVDVRVLAATNRDLPAEIERGRFRPDLFHRLNGFPIEVPPLRERREDIPILVGHFLDGARSQLGLGDVRISAAALSCLDHADWPGNVRELEHVIKRAVLRASKGRTDAITLECEHVGEQTARAAESVAARPKEVLLPAEGFQIAVDGFKRALVSTALEESGGNWAEAARRLKMDRGNLLRLGRRLGLR